MARLSRNTLAIKRVLWFSAQRSSEMFRNLRIIQQVIFIYVLRLPYKFQVFLPDFNKTWNFSTYYNNPITNFMKSLLLIAELYNVDGRAERLTDRQTVSQSVSQSVSRWVCQSVRHIDMTELIIAFNNFENAPNFNDSIYHNLWSSVKN